MVPVLTSETFWNEVYAIFDPLRPVDKAALRVARECRYSPVEKLVPRLLKRPEHQRLLVAGGIGSGKSTEILVTAEHLVGKRTVVVFDLWQHMESAVKDNDALQHVQPWEILALVGLATARATSEHFGLPCDTSDLSAALNALREEPSTSSTLDIAKLASGLAIAVGGALAGPAGGLGVAAGLTALKAIGDAWNWKIGLKDSDRKRDQDEAVDTLVKAVSALLENLRTRLDRRVVMVVDGLDRIRHNETFKAIFVESSLLHQLPCDILVSAHLALVQRNCSFVRFERYDLANVPVADPFNPRLSGKGIDFFRTLVALRLQAVRDAGLTFPDNVLPDSVIERLAWCSGGRIRDFIGFVREIATLTDEDNFEIDRDLVESILDDARRRKSDGLDADQISLLESVVRDPFHRLPGGEIALGLLEQQLLLPYPNDDLWYLPHPLLMLTLVRPG